MFKLNLKIAWRNLWKNKGYTLINVLGLSIGMASCILIFIFIRYQISFDEGFKNEDRIYRITTNWTSADGFFESQGVPKPAPAALRNDFKNQIEKVGAICQDGGIIKVKDDAGKEKIKTMEDIFYAEPEFFQIMSFEWLQGNPVQSLSQPNTVVLSKDMATKLFGDWNKAVGRTINYQNREDFTVTGILQEMPENSSFPLNIVVSYQTFKNHRNEKFDNWGNVSSSDECYFLLKDGVSIDEVRGALPKFSEKYFEKDAISKQEINAQALSEIHYNENLGNFSNDVMPKKELYGLGIIGAFLMLTACINFINLATAQAVSRSKEVGVRKVMGSLRKQLIFQFLTETLTISVFALLVACVLTEVALPGMKSLFHDNISFSITSHPVILVFMIGLVLIVSFLAGFYPAMVMSGFSPALAIKNKITANAGGLSLRKILVVVQFSITVILIIGTLVVLRQMNYMREKPLGFNPSAIAMVGVRNDSLSLMKYQILQDRFSKIPGVLTTSFCRNGPSSSNNNESNFRYDGSEKANFQVNTKIADEYYFKTFGLKFVAGKGFSKSDTIKEVVVNETTLKKLNVVDFNDALGKKIKIFGKEATLVGVVKDFNNLSLHEPISPVLITSIKENYQNIAVKMDSKQILSIMPQIEKIWNDTYPENFYQASFVEDDISQYYETERVMGVLFKVFAGVIIFISFIGLFGLISFVATQRTKEVAIRKVLGASTIELVKMLNGSFLLMVFIANVIAWPLAYLFVSKWLSGFTYRIEVSIWPFALAMIISMLITLITVSFRSLKAVRANTIDALKYE
ncbi:FtsX-like permease family protein [Pedobacter petrophilus]|uniref:FtsX-like permease family protein n=1 Tax=Pedobacter petrophilus TaxID=1908241 RepID=A0A7K0G5C5_9SPHI|nr:ABC transporter permease [Pedobacter petrophilus]MRX78429.1 FtsX-like permease family protein [Pedobacter petrophilus]